MPTDSFTLPLTKQDRDREWPQDPICVVGIIGKGGAGSADKATLTNLALDRLIFPVQYQSQRSLLGNLRHLSEAETSDSENREVSFSGYYDAEQQILYLQLLSMHDATHLAKLCQQTQRSLSQSSWHDIWLKREQSYCNALLFLFCTCHIIMVSHPTELFDPSYVHMFESLCAIREDLETDLIHYLEDSLDDSVCGLWLNSGRCALPRLLFVMQQTSAMSWQAGPPQQQSMLQTMDAYPARDAGGPDSTSRVSDNWVQRQTTRYGAANPAKRFQLFAEDQIYNICKKCRTRLMTGENALFTLSPHKFLHAVPPSLPEPGLTAASSLDSMTILMRGMSAAGNADKKGPPLRTVGRSNGGHQLSDMRSPSASARPPSPAAATSTSGRNSPNFAGSISGRQAFSVRPVPGPARSSDRPADESQRLQSFLQRHVEAIHHGTDAMVFDKTAIGKNDCRLPNCDDWFEVASVLYDFFLGADGVGDQYEARRVRMPLQLQHQFSESRCSKALPTAMNTYKDGLPNLYTLSRHRIQLENALRAFSLQARGPLSQKYIDDITTQCEQYWREGHQSCERVSMTGRACQLPQHLLPASNGGELSDSADSLRMAHSNTHVAIHSCNCGRSQSKRSDPFTLKDANFSFYDNLEQTCCGGLERVIFACAPPLYANAVGDFSLPVPCSDTGDVAGSRRQSQSNRQSSVPTLQSEDSLSLYPPLTRSSPLPELSPRVAATPDAPASVQARLLAKKRDGLLNNEHQAVDEFSDVSSDGDQPTANLESSAQPAAASGKTHGEAVSSLVDVSPSPKVSVGASLAGVIGDEGDIAEDTGGTDWPLYADVLDSNLGDAEAGPQNDGAQEYDPEDYEEDADTLRPNLTSLSACVSMEASEGHVMVHSSSPAGLVPAFPSWSVITLGSASLYTSGTGLPQPGFLQGSNFLLAWDIPSIITTRTAPIHLSGAAAWTSFTESMQRSRPVRAPKTTKGLLDLNGSTRVFVGMEYECFHGNRFLAAGPNKASKIHPTGHLKDSASRVLATPMPLYMGCPCRQAGKAHMAQLMRFFITTPPEGIQIALHPRIQPAPSPCPVFHAGMGPGVVLPPNSFCVLRFPYIYADDTGTILPPADHSPNVRSCHLLEGLIELRSLATDAWR